MHPLLIFIVFLSIFQTSTPELQTASGVDSILYPPLIDFGQSLTFAIELHTTDMVAESTLLLEPAGQDTRLIPFVIDSNGNATVVYDLKSQPLRAFSSVNFWLRVVLQSGETYTSPIQTFTYADNQYDWQQLVQGQVSIAWVDGDTQFGQDAMNTAQKAQQSVAAILPEAPQPEITRIYIYPDSQSLQNSLSLTDTPWAGGHASPDLGVILISVAPGPSQRSEMEQLIPHEWMHLAQYQVMGDSYSQLPTWLTEGMASLAELYPNPDYQSAVELAGKEDRLMPITSLCGAFPKDLSAAYLAYAESDSFVRFLYQNYGASGLRKLMAQYQDGLGCEEGFRGVFDDTLLESDANWRQSLLGEQYSLNIWSNLIPYAVLLVLVLAPLGLSIGLAARRQPQKE